MIRDLLTVGMKINEKRIVWAKLGYWKAESRLLLHDNVRPFTSILLYASF